MEKYKNVIQKQFKMSAPAWNDKFELPNRTDSVSGIQDYFEYILKEHGEETDNPLRKIYTTKIENRIIFEIKAGYYIKLISSESIKSFGSTKSKITKDENSKNMPHLKYAILICSIMVMNKIQQFCICIFPINVLANY